MGSSLPAAVSDAEEWSAPGGQEYRQGAADHPSELDDVPAEPNPGDQGRNGQANAAKDLWGYDLTSTLRPAEMLADLLTATSITKHNNALRQRGHDKRNIRLSEFKVMSDAYGIVMAMDLHYEAGARYDELLSALLESASQLTAFWSDVRQEQVRDYQGLRRLFLQYTRPNDARLLYEQALDYVQKANQSPVDYVREKKDLFVRAGQADIGMLMPQVIRGLQPEYRVKIHEMPYPVQPHTYGALLDTLRQLEGTHKATKAMRQAQAQPKTPPTTAVTTREDTDDEEDITRTSAPVKRKSTASNEAEMPGVVQSLLGQIAKAMSQGKQDGCFFCHTPGHFRDQCSKYLAFLEEHPEEKEAWKARVARRRASRDDGGGQRKRSRPSTEPQRDEAAGQERLSGNGGSPSSTHGSDGQ